jgi:hypothetical protein
MNTLRISLEYNCYPVWIIDSGGDVIDNDPPNDIRNIRELDDLFLKIQEMFDSCFVDTPKEFTPQGFKFEEEKASFLELVDSADTWLRKEAEGKYFVKNRVKL